MNVFFTNQCPVKSARDHNKKHRNKMIVEYAQLLSSAHHLLDGDNAIDGIYKKTHQNHPSAVWCRKSITHYDWVLDCAFELCAMYTRDTGKVHKTQVILELLRQPPINIPALPFVEPPVAAPDEFKAVAIFKGAAVAYQQYLVSKFKEWQQRDKPIAVEFDYKPDWV